MIDDLPPLSQVVRAHGLAPKKALGQNFLFDLNLTSKIARLAGDLTEGDVRLARLERTAMLFRHFSLSLDDEVPLAIGAFCLALALARLRRQSRNG